MCVYTSSRRSSVFFKDVSCEGEMRWRFHAECEGYMLVISYLWPPQASYSLGIPLYPIYTECFQIYTTNLFTQYHLHNVNKRSFVVFFFSLVFYAIRKYLTGIYDSIFNNIFAWNKSIFYYIILPTLFYKILFFIFLIYDFSSFRFSFVVLVVCIFSCCFPFVFFSFCIFFFLLFSTGLLNIDFWALAQGHVLKNSIGE